MVSEIELGLLVATIVLVLVAFVLLKAVKGLAINAIVGIAILLIADGLGLGIQITATAVLICSIGGIPGALLVILLAYLDIAFAGFAVVPL